MNYIYRDFCLQRLSKDACQKFLQAIAASGGTIKSSFSLSNGFSFEQMAYHSMFFKLRFSNQTQLDKFHSCGFQTTEPEKISGQNNEIN